ncbi:hypothetical protein MMC16_007434 [Acarospora aff. strigata]|nr:hypothetical protein [Acarospora aff. strigata]
MAMPILSIDLTTIPDSEPERRSSLGHKTCPIDPDSLPEMGDTGNADIKTPPEDADDDSEFPKLDKLLSAFQRRERKAEQKGSYFNADLSLERTLEQLDRQTQSDNSAVSSQPVAGDSHATVIDNNDISIISDNIDVENGRVGTFDLDFVTITSPHDLEGDMEKTEFGLGFDQRIPTSLHQSESATVSDWAIPNDRSRSISDFSYSDGNATNLLKKGKK